MVVRDFTKSSAISPNRVRVAPGDPRHADVVATLERREAETAAIAEAEDAAIRARRSRDSRLQLVPPPF